MKVTVIGTGYVGLVTGTCFADMGNDVCCVDIDRKKIENLKNGIIPIYEPGLEELVKSNYSEGRLTFTTDLKEPVSGSLFVFIAVGTPPGEDGSADLSYVIKAAEDVAGVMDKYTVIVDKSTVPVGTASLVKEHIAKVLKERDRADIEFDVVSNPEFLKEGNAVEDFMKPERVIIGTDNVRTAELMMELYSPFVRQNDRFHVMNLASAEMTKYAANAMLATRISFMNELSILCEKTGADIEMIRKGIGSDSRIGKGFLYAGIGYGGSCFPKDVKALIRTSHDYGISPFLLEAVEKVNKNQRERFIERIISHYGEDVEGKIFALWGLAFKPQTDDIREAPAVDIIRELTARGAKIKAYDPIAAENVKALFGSKNIEYYSKNYDALQDADALIIATEWFHFRNPDFSRMKSLLKYPVIFDGRNQYEPKKMKEEGFTYFCIGR